MERCCERAQEIGLPALAFTEHADFVTIHKGQHSVDIVGYLEAIEICRAKFKGLRILSGVELGEPHWFPKDTAEVLSAGKLDRVLGSIHCVHMRGEEVDASQFRLRPRAEQAEAITEYFRETLAMVESSQPFEVLAHLDYPKRYWPDGMAPYKEEDYEEQLRAVLLAAAKRGGVAVPTATSVIESSPHRVQPKCPYFGKCGGCQWQHASYEHQLELKRQVVEEAWARAGLRLPPDTPVLGMDDPWRYRIRGEFEAVPTPAGWRFGFHRLRSHSVLAIDTCPIHDLHIEHALPAFAQAPNDLKLTDLQNLLLTAEPNGRGLLWRLRVKGKEARWPRGGFGHRGGELLPRHRLVDR